MDFLSAFPRRVARLVAMLVVAGTLIFAAGCGSGNAMAPVAEGTESLPTPA